MVFKVSNEHLDITNESYHLTAPVFPLIVHDCEIRDEILSSLQ